MYYKQLLLRIEKYPHRMNFNKGILESRRLHYEHLYKLLVGWLLLKNQFVNILIPAEADSPEYSNGDRAHSSPFDPGYPF